MQSHNVWYLMGGQFSRHNVTTGKTTIAMPDVHRSLVTVHWSPFATLHTAMYSFTFAVALVVCNLMQSSTTIMHYHHCNRYKHCHHCHFSKHYPWCGEWGGEKHGAHVVHVAGDYLKNARRFHASVLTCSSYPTLHFMFRVLGLTFRFFFFFFFFFFVPSVGLIVIVMVMVIVVIVVMIIKDDNDDDEDENGDTMVTT
jgi:hypothetical protein